MMVEETVWEDHETCDHSYDKRCHKSYTTTYTPVQVTQGYRANMPLTVHVQYFIAGDGV